MSRPARILLALVAGLLLGIAAPALGPQWVEWSTAVAAPIGDLWLDALQMTIVPLVVSLLITGIVESASHRAGRLTGRAFLLFLLLLWSSALLAALLTPLLIELFPLPSDAVAALRNALGEQPPPAQVPGFAEFLGSIVPSNPVAAAASDAILPLLLFSLVFAFAATRIPAGQKTTLVRFFRAVADTMLVVIGWVLWVAPIGVLALAYSVGARAGGEAFGALLHYVFIVSAVGLVVWLAAWPLAWAGAGVSPLRFTGAIAPSQAVALSTQSSLATLPAMLKAAAALDIPVASSGILLPMAVAIFRATGPAMNLAVVIYIAYWYGLEPGPAAVAFGVAAAATTTMGAAGIPGQASFVTSIAPICLAMGVPIEPLGLLLAVEMVPDLVRTIGNVSMDVAATATVARRSGGAEEPESAEDRLVRSS